MKQSKKDQECWGSSEALRFLKEYEGIDLPERVKFEKSLDLIMQMYVSESEIYITFSFLFLSIYLLFLFR